MNLDFDESDFDIISDIPRSDWRAARSERIRNLKGRYVVSCIGASSGRVVFRQDPRVSRKGYWTQFLSNAQGYDTLEEAEAECKKFQYGRPRVARVEQNGNFNFKFRPLPALHLNSTHTCEVRERSGGKFVVDILDKYGITVREIQVPIDMLKSLGVIKSASGLKKAEKWLNTGDGKHHLNIRLNGGVER